MYIMGLDLGYSSVKVVVANEYGEILKKFKFPSLIGITKKVNEVENDKIYQYDDNYYMVGDEAKHLPSQNMIDITEYKNLEYYAPLLLKHTIKKCGITPDIIVAGLSIAQINYSGYFQARLESFTIDETDYKFEKVYVLPQGAGAKLAIDKYGNKFPEEQKEFLGTKNYIICDIGANTIDMLSISDGVTDSSLWYGEEKQGMMLVASKIAQEVYKTHNRQITLQEAKEIMEQGYYKLRGSKYDYKEFVETTKKEYLKSLLKLVEEKFPSFLDKADFLCIVGGGATLFKDTTDNFIRIVRNDPEFYNAIGQMLFGLRKL